MSISTIFLLDFGIVSTVWILELFRQCGFWNCFDSVDFGIVSSVDFGIVSTVWILELFRQCGILGFLSYW